MTLKQAKLLDTLINMYSLDYQKAKKDSASELGISEDVLDRVVHDWMMGGDREKFMASEKNQSADPLDRIRPFDNAAKMC